MVERDCLIYWVDEILVVRVRDVWIMIDVVFKSLDYETLPGASAEDIAHALSRAQAYALRPDRWPTRRLPLLGP